MPQFIKNVRTSTLKLDRVPVGPRTLELVRFLERGGYVPPIHVKKNVWGQWFVLDGRHRATAYKLLGREWVMVRYGQEA